MGYRQNCSGHQTTFFSSSATYCLYEFSSISYKSNNLEAEGPRIAALLSGSFIMFSGLQDHH
ncbi:MAG: hypothetical protein ACREBI_11750 [Nitrosotalea sp.]